MHSVDRPKIIWYSYYRHEYLVHDIENRRETSLKKFTLRLYLFQFFERENKRKKLKYCKE